MGQKGEERHESVPAKRQDGGAGRRSTGSWRGVARVFISALPHTDWVTLPSVIIKRVMVQRYVHYRVPGNP